MGFDTVDGHVQVPSDASGKKIDNSVITRDDGVLYYRQRQNIGDPVDPNELVEVKRGQLIMRDPEMRELLSEILFVLQAIYEKLET